MKLAWTDRALGRVRETARYIAAADPAAAVRWTEGLFGVESVLILTVGHASRLIREDKVAEG